jgi:DNA-binding beta-propeller fold protein YncE
MPDIGQPSETDKNTQNEIRDGVVSDATRFPGGFIDQQVTEAGAAVQIVGKFQANNASHVRSFNVSGQDVSPVGLTFKPDGSQLYVLGNNTNNVYQYSLTTAYDISTASFSQSFDVSGQDIDTQGLTFKPDGSQLYVTGNNTDNVYEYSLSTPYDISTAGSTGVFDVSGQDGVPEGIAFNSDGTKMYVVGNEFENVNEYSLTTAFDISTASISQSFDVAPQDGAPQGLAFKPDGGRMYVVGRNNTNINQYSLTTAFDTSTASFVQARSVTKRTARPSGIAFKPDGSQLYVTGKSNATVLQYSVGVIGAELE